MDWPLRSLVVMSVLFGLSVAQVRCKGCPKKRCLRVYLTTSAFCVSSFVGWLVSDLLPRMRRGLAFELAGGHVSVVGLTLLTLSQNKQGGRCGGCNALEVQQARWREVVNELRRARHAALSSRLVLLRGRRILQTRARS